MAIQLFLLVADMKFFDKNRLKIGLRVRLTSSWHDFFDPKTRGRCGCHPADMTLFGPPS